MENWLGEWKDIILGEDKSGCHVVKSLDEIVIFPKKQRRGNATSLCKKPVILLLDIEINGSTRNFWFELFSFRSIPLTHLWNDRKGWVFGQISASDKFGLQISRACEVRGYIVAYYGDNFFAESQSETETISKDCYMALLFRRDPPYVLKDGDIIPLIKSMLAVPTKGSLIVKAYMEDVHSDKVIMNDCFKFKPLLNGFTSITGSKCSLDLTASWNYLARYL